MRAAWFACGAAISLALTLSGCGMSQLERHTMGAGLLHGGTGLAAKIIDEGAREAAARAGDETEIQPALRPWRQAEAVQHLAAAAVDAYVAEVLVMAAGPWAVCWRWWGVRYDGARRDHRRRSGVPAMAAQVGRRALYRSVH